MIVDLPVKICVGHPCLTVTTGTPRFAPSQSRNGGKPAAKRLTKPVKPAGKRAAFLRWFLAEPGGRTVDAAMANFSMSRPNVFAYWTAINRDHGVGYTLANNTITAVLPPGTDSGSVFGVAK